MTIFKPGEFVRFREPDPSRYREGRVLAAEAGGLVTVQWPIPMLGPCQVWHSILEREPAHA